MTFKSARGHSASYIRSVSTTWVWKKVKIERAAGPDRSGARRATSGSRQAERPWIDGAALDRRVHTVQIKHRGGAECWWEIGWAGDSVRLPGHLSLHDALAIVLDLKTRERGV